MKRDVLQKILQTGTGLVEKGGAFIVPAEHRVTVHLGTESRGLMVNDVEEIRLLDLFITIIARDVGEVYVEYGEVFAVAIKPPKTDAKARAGFA